MKKFLSLLVSCGLVLGLSWPTSAMENGNSALGDDRIISTRTHGSSAFLFDDRIVFTNAHALYKQGGEPWPLDSFSVSPPGTMTGSRVGAAKVIKTFVAPGYRDWNPRVDWARPNDFAILILDRPIANVTRATVATETQLNEFRAQGALVETGGYGYQSVEDRGSENRGPRIVEPKKASLRMASGDYLANAVAGHIAGRWYDKNRVEYPAILGYHLIAPYEGPGTCDGDSGSGFYIRDGKNVTYLGTIGSHLGITNCGADEPIPGYTPLIGITPAFPFLDLIAQAETWVSQNPVSASTPMQKTLSSFGSGVSLSGTQKTQIREFVAMAGSSNKFICTGIRYKSQPMSENIRVRARAKAACDYAKSLNGNLSTWYQSKVTTAKSYSGRVLLNLKN